MKTKTKKPTKLEQTANAIIAMAARVHVLTGEIKSRAEELHDLKQAMDPFLPEGATRAGNYRIQKTAFKKKWMAYWRKAYSSITVRKMKARRKPKRELVMAACLLVLSCLSLPAQSRGYTRNAYINERLPYALGLYPWVRNNYTIPTPLPAPQYTFDGRWRTAATNVAKIEAAMRINQAEQSLLLRIGNNRTPEQEIRLVNLGRALPFQQDRIAESRRIMGQVVAEFQLRDLKYTAVK